MRISVVGGGFMGEAIVAQALARGITTPEAVCVCEAYPARRDDLAARYHVAVTGDYAPLADRTDLLVIAVKPQDFPTVAAGLRAHLHPEQAILSIMAGVRIEAVTAALGSDRVMRVMPNLPATIGEAFSTWTASATVPDDGRAAARTLLAALGRELYVADERQIDYANAVAGSGPGYVMLLLEGLIDGAVHIGLGRAVATEMVLQTVLGSVRWAQADGAHPAELRARVSSPGGTTVEGLYALEKHGVRAALIDAVIAGYQKSRALGG